MLRIAKKEELPRWKSILVRLASVLFGVLFACLLIALIGYNPISTFSALIVGAFGSQTALINTITIAIPLAITALGLAIAFRMKFWNIGGEGQIIMGCIFATFVANNMPSNTPGILHILLMGAAGFLGGAIWALIPGIFRVFSKTNETLFTLMMNYIALSIVQFLHYVLWRDPASKGFPKIKAIPLSTHLPVLFGVHIGWIIAIIIAIMVFYMIRKTKLGYEIRVVGESEPTANYAGINVKKVMLTGVALSGGIVGLAGMIKLSGAVYTLSPAITGNAGFTAIVIAWLSGLSAPIILIVSILIAALEQGSQIIQIKLSVPSSVAAVIQGLILMSALGGEFFLRYRIIREKKNNAKIQCSPDNGKAASDKSAISESSGDLENAGESSMKGDA
jgi:simple sugar transport system permease protein